MKHPNILLLFILVLLGNSACGKKDKEPQLSTEELLTTSDWYLEKYGESAFASCHKRTTYRFAVDGSLERLKYSIDVGDECVLDEHDIGTWRILNDGKDLEMKFGGGPHTFEIIQISSTELHLYGSWSRPDVDFILDKTPH